MESYGVVKDMKNIFMNQLLCGTAMLISAVTAQNTYAQESDPSEDAAKVAETAQQGTIVVTGSRIARPNLDSAAPITTITSDTLTQSGNTGAGDIIQYVPALFNSTNSDLSATRGNLLGGTSLNLRGLGAARTLVLVNGRRHVASSAGTAIVDVETIPTALIQRVDVLTGGASSVYGSDAVSGVVNYILKKDFDGLTLDGQSGISGRGDAADYSLSGTIGKNFADGRGNVSFAAQYNRSRAITYGDRSFLVGNQRLDDDSNPALASNPNAAPRAFLPNRTFSISSLNGLIGFDADSSFAVTDLRTDFDRNGVNDCDQTVNSTVFGVGFGCYVVDPRTRAIRPFRDGLIAGDANQFGGDGVPVFLDQENIIPEVEQINVNLNFNFEISPAFKPFVESKFVRTNASEVNNVNSFNDTIPIRLDNPFIPAALRSAITSYYLANPGLNPADGQVLISRDNADFGRNSNNVRRDTYRIVGGVTGDLGGSWNYEVSANYGRSEERTIAPLTRLEDRFYAAVDAVVDPATGNIVCRSALNPNTIPGTSPLPAYNADPDRDGIFEPVTFRTNDGSCRPLNLFGFGSPSAEAINFVNQPNTSNTTLEQLVFQGFITGTTESFFSLPGGAPAIALGVEYRKENSRFEVDENERLGLFYESGTQPSGGKFNVWEVFGELQLPILADVPLAKELTLKGSARYSKYSLNNVGGVFTWGLDGVYAPVKDLQFRVSYARSIRAPNIGNLFAPTSPATFRPVDVCSATQIGRGSNPAVRLANCRADGIPVGFTDPLTARITGNASGNPVLEEERSKSLTAGVVIQPSFLPGFSATIDYWQYNITNAIASVPADDIVSGCYDSANFPNSPFCALFTRNRVLGSPTFLGFNNLRNSPINFARFEARGIDFQANYRLALGGDAGSLNARIGGTYNIRGLTFDSVSNLSVPDLFIGEAQSPEVAFSTGLEWQKGAFRIGWESFWQSKQFYQGVDVETPADFATPNRDPNFWSHDVNLGYEVNERFSLRAGVNNLTNKKPFRAEAAYPISAIGRSFFLGATAKF
jgi:iron complex outermembrane recepter protein